MKHEHFKSFEVNQGKPSEELNSFLTGHITAKSISVATLTPDKYIVIIGYVNSKSEHQYSILTQSLGKVTDLQQIDSLLENAAKALEGVVCQHVSIEEGGLHVAFLTSK